LQFELLGTLQSALKDVSVELQRAELTQRGVAINAMTYASSLSLSLGHALSHIARLTPSSVRHTVLWAVLSPSMLCLLVM
jgi:hypothetical protein